MNARWLVWTTRALLVFALGVSAALLADYSTSSPAFCSAGSGCDTVRRSGLGYIPLGGGAYMPVPVLGLIGFGVTLVFTLLVNWRLRRMLTLSFLAAGGFLAAGLIGVQGWFIGEFCSLCVMVDGAALAACAAAFAIPKQGWETTTGEDTSRAPKRYGLPPTLSWAALAALGIAAPYFWPKLRPAPPVPPKVAAFYQPGKINVVEFADFECPFCRRLHSELKQIISDYPGKVHFVRLHMPLERHERARPAARAAVCATRQNHEESMADYLFAAESLDDKAIFEGARRVGLDLAAFKSCLTDPATDRSIDEHVAILRDAGFQGLPTTYVGASKIVGAQPEEVFRDAFDQAGRGQGGEGIPPWLYWPVVLIASAAVLWFGRFKGASQTATSGSSTSS